MLRLLESHLQQHTEHGFGPSEARVRVWLDGSLHYASEPVLLHQGDLWEVGSIEPSNGKFVPLVGEGDTPKLWQFAPAMLSKF